MKVIVSNRFRVNSNWDIFYDAGHTVVSIQFSDFSFGLVKERESIPSTMQSVSQYFVYRPVDPTIVSQCEMNGSVKLIAL